MSTVLDIIKGAFKDINQTAGTEAPTADEQADALTRLNQLLGQFGAEGEVAYTQKTYTSALQTGVSAYTVGSGGTFNTGERVQKLIAWRAYYSTLLHSGGRVLPLDEFGATAQQQNGINASVPTVVGADTAYPLINLRVFPPPSLTPGTLEVDGWTPIPTFAATSDVLALPAGWELLLRTALAIDLLPSYPREGVNPEILAANLQKAKAAIMGQNAMKSAAPAQ